MGNRVIDFRVSTLPCLFGEKIVLRILDKGNLTLDLSTFGFEPKQEQDLLRAILNPYGMVLVTGPPGRARPRRCTPRCSASTPSTPTS
jgi:type IV pilus assembly protein PilB